jgi:hypothetical protein
MDARSVLNVVAVSLVVVGCGNEQATPLDLAAQGEDMAVAADMAGALDMAGPDLAANLFCDHLRATLAGAPASDCAVAYVAKLMSCFGPAGACGAVGRGPSTDSECWANGAVFGHVYILGTESYTYARNGRRCGTVQTDTGGPYSAGFCLSTSSYDCHPENTTDMAGSVARYLGGTFTCLDGTQLPVGTMFNCAEVKQFLMPACDGTVDAGGCVVP